MAALLLAAASGCASGGGPTPGTGELPPSPFEASETEGGATSFSSDIPELLDTPPYEVVNFGVLAVDALSGDPLYARNQRRRFVPASNQKVLVAAAALGLLGPGYNFATEVWATGSTFGETLDGDLVVVASGDPSMSGRFWESGEAALYAIADSLHGLGLRHVTGSLFIDVSSWDSASVGPTWEVEDLPYGYGATGGAFAIDEGVVRVVVEAGPAVGSPASVSWRPLGTRNFVAARIETVQPTGRTRVRASFLPESRRLRLEGEIAMGTVDTLVFASRDPVRQATAALKRSIEKRGIVVEGTAQVAWIDGVRVGRGCLSGGVEECPNAGRLTVLESPPISELVKAVLGASQNWMTEQLLRALGAELGEDGSWSEGLRLMTEYLAEVAGINPPHFVPRDGSGLSAHNLVTPAGMVRVLEHLDLSGYGEIVRDAMAAPDREDSTLEDRLPELEGRLFAKTGTISNVNSLSGYLVAESGREVIFSILSNGSGLPAREVREAIDELVRMLARY